MSTTSLTQWQHVFANPPTEGTTRHRHIIDSRTLHVKDLGRRLKRMARDDHFRRAVIEEIELCRREITAARCALKKKP